MPSIKERSPFIAAGGLTVGTTGASFGDIIYGSACINCPSALGDEVVVGASVAITGVEDGDVLFVTPMASLETGMSLLAACAVSGGISASWVNSGSADASASADVAVSYLVFS